MSIFTNPHSISRRQFINNVSGVTATVSAAGVSSTIAEVAGTIENAITEARRTGRANRSYQVRLDAARHQRSLPLADQPTNGDEQLFANRIANYTKALPHNTRGEVDPDAYTALARSLIFGRPADFESIPRPGVAKQTNPQAALAFELEGADSHHLGVAAPPAFSSAEQAGEMAELHWQALTRDVPFAGYDDHPLTDAAAVDLSQLSDFRGPKVNRKVTAQTLFRGTTPGDALGPYISQFLWQDFQYGATPFVQRNRTAVPGVEHLVAYADWLNVQNGSAPMPQRYDPTLRYIRNNRDLGEYVRTDFTYQAFLNACLILFGVKAPVDAGNPYRKSQTQIGFITFGGSSILDLVARVANCALKAAWYQKWWVHRRLRPEEFGGRLHNHKTGRAIYPLHSDLLNSATLDAVYNKHGTYLLPQAYPEGCPTHPAYPAGHAAIAGACTTVLKAFFDESFALPNAVEASADGLSLNPYTGAGLTVGGELNKLASNIAIGRNAAGVHWRSDASEGLKLGEAVAIGVLTDMKHCFNEQFEGFTFTKFDGTTVMV